MAMGLGKLTIIATVPLVTMAAAVALLPRYRRLGSFLRLSPEPVGI